MAPQTVFYILAGCVAVAALVFVVMIVVTALRPPQLPELDIEPPPPLQRVIRALTPVPFAPATAGGALEQARAPSPPLRPSSPRLAPTTPQVAPSVASPPMSIARNAAQPARVAPPVAAPVARSITPASTSSSAPPVATSSAPLAAPIAPPVATSSVPPVAAPIAPPVATSSAPPVAAPIAPPFATSSAPAPAAQPLARTTAKPVARTITPTAAPFAGYVLPSAARRRGSGVTAAPLPSTSRLDRSRDMPRLPVYPQRRAHWLLRVVLGMFVASVLSAGAVVAYPALLDPLCDDYEWFGAQASQVVREHAQNARAAIVELIDRL